MVQLLGENWEMPSGRQTVRRLTKCHVSFVDVIKTNLFVVLLCDNSSEVSCSILLEKIMVMHTCFALGLQIIAVPLGVLYTSYISQ